MSFGFPQFNFGMGGMAGQPNMGVPAMPSVGQQQVGAPMQQPQQGQIDSQLLQTLHPQAWQTMILQQQIAAQMMLQQQAQQQAAAKGAMPNMQPSLLAYQAAIAQANYQGQDTTHLLQQFQAQHLIHQQQLLQQQQQMQSKREAGGDMVSLSLC
jgi:hypothetical protein